jgi:ADP-ribose pyrophosphatase YjhB (NUDIX family)
MARETAAAAVGVRGAPGSVQVCVVQQGEQWGLPWAMVGKGEVPKQTALRALAEASGVKAGLQDVDSKFYKTIEQVYRRGIDKVRREVHFFRVRAPADPSGGIWLGPQEALAKVTSKAVREVLEAALASELGPSTTVPQRQPQAPTDDGGP